MTIKEKEKQNSTRMTYWRRSCKKMVMGKVPKRQILEPIQTTKALLEGIEEEELRNGQIEG